MKLKYYLRGLGTGIIFTAIVLAIIYAYRTTDSKIIDKAKELGMVMISETTAPEEPGTSEAKPRETTGTDISTQHVGEEETTEEESTTEEAATEPPTTDNLQQGEAMVLTITNGMSSEAVAVKLKEMGVIDDVTAFNSYMIKGGYAGRIRVGTFTINKGSTYEQIAGLIAGN